MTVSIIYMKLPISIKDAMERNSIVYVVKEGRYRTSDEYQMEHFGDILPVV